jgi:hypothetical protein
MISTLFETISVYSRLLLSGTGHGPGIRGPPEQPGCVWSDHLTIRWCVCMYLWMYVCICMWRNQVTCMYVFMNVCICVCVMWRDHLNQVMCMYVCIYVCMRVCMSGEIECCLHFFVCICMPENAYRCCLHVHACMCMYVCMRHNLFVECRVWLYFEQLPQNQVTFVHIDIYSHMYAYGFTLSKYLRIE